MAQQELMDFSLRESDDTRKDVDINTVVKSAITLTMPMIRKATSHFRVTYGKDIPLLKGRFQQLEQVIIYLVQNACQPLLSGSSFQ
jgi:C4-dicarboxylate-specific signal transduction histidine kinase